MQNTPKKGKPTPKNPQRRNKWRRIGKELTSLKKLSFLRGKMILRSETLAKL